MKKRIFISRAAIWALALALGMWAGTTASEKGWNLGMTVAGVAVVILLASFAVNLYWAAFISKKINALQPVLNAQNDPDRYIEKLTSLTEGIRGSGLEDIVHINLAVAYARKDDLDTALEHMGLVKAERLKGLNRGIYWGDLALFCYEKGDIGTADRLLEDHRDEIGAYGSSKQAGPLCDMLRIYSALHAGDRDEASRLLARAEEDWRDRVEAQQDLRILRERLARM